MSKLSRAIAVGEVNMKFISSFSESEPIRFALKKADAVLDDAWEVSLQQ